MAFSFNLAQARWRARPTLALISDFIFDAINKARAKQRRIFLYNTFIAHCNDNKSIKFLQSAYW